MRRIGRGSDSAWGLGLVFGGTTNLDTVQVRPFDLPPSLDVLLAQRMIRDATGNTEYEFGDGSKALAAGTSDAAEKAREAKSE